MTLSTRILAALLIGILLGALARLPGAWWLRDGILFAEPLGIIFIRLISMVVVPLVIASLFAGIASLGDVRRLGRLGGRTVLWFVCTTAAAAAIGATLAMLAHAGQGFGAGVLAQAASRVESPLPIEIHVAPALPTYPGWMQSLIDITPQNPISAAAQGDLLPLIIAVCLFGAAATVVPADRRRPLVAFFDGVNSLAMVVIGWVMRLAPAAVLVLIGVLVVKTGLDILRSLLFFMAIVVGALGLHVALVLTPALRLRARMTVRCFLSASSDALLLAFSTASSTAALPVSMAAAERLHVPQDVAGFVLPTGTTVNKNGAAAYKAVTAVFIAHLAGMQLGAGQWLAIVLASTMAAFAGAGVPGSSLVTTMIVLNAIGLGERATAGILLVAGVDRPLDMCRTLVNTIGNLVVAVVVGKAPADRS